MFIRPRASRKPCRGFFRRTEHGQWYQADRQAARDRKRAADNADAMQKVQLDEAGYDRITMPTIQAPPGQNFAQKVGSYLSGGSDQPTSIIMKTHVSAHDTDVANAQSFELARDSAHFKNERDIEAMRTAIEAQRFNATQAGEDRRAAAAQAGENYRAGLYRATSKAALGQTAKHSVVDDAIDATGGYAERAWNSIPASVKKQYGLTLTDMNAGTQRFTDRKAALTREGIDAANERAAARGGSGMLPRDLNGKRIPPPAPAAGGEVDNGPCSSPAQPSRLLRQRRVSLRVPAGKAQAARAP